MSLSANYHVGVDYVTTVDTHAPSSTTATVKVTKSPEEYGGVILFFTDLAHTERWAREVLGRVEVAKTEAANDQAKNAAPDPVPVQPAGEVVESAVDTSPATEVGRYLEEGFVCPEADHHGNPFRYCPVKGCGWREGQPVGGAA